jgi:CRP-like cAMP-binding protein
MLMGIAVWGNLGDRDLGELAVAASHRSYDCREVIVGPEAANDSVFAIVSGEVSVRRVSADGKEIVLRLLEPGEVFGAVSDEAGIEPKSSFVAEKERTEVIRLPAARVTRALKQSPAAATAEAAMWRRRLSDADDLAERLAFDHVDRRVVRALAELAAANHGVVHVTNQELAARAGTCREEVTKTLRRLRELGLIQHQRYSRTIIVQHPATLMEDFDIATKL